MNMKTLQRTLVLLATIGLSACSGTPSGDDLPEVNNPDQGIVEIDDAEILPDMAEADASAPTTDAEILVDEGTVDQGMAADAAPEADGGDASDAPPVAVWRWGL